MNCQREIVSQTLNFKTLKLKIMVTIKRNLEIRLNGKFFVKAHLSRIFNKKTFENYSCQGDWKSAKYALDLTTQPQFNTHFKLFKSLNDVRKFISQNF